MTTEGPGALRRSSNAREESIIAVSRHISRLRRLSIRFQDRNRPYNATFRIFNMVGDTQKTERERRAYTENPSSGVLRNYLFILSFQPPYAPPTSELTKTPLRRDVRVFLCDAPWLRVGYRCGAAFVFIRYNANLALAPPRIECAIFSECERVNFSRTDSFPVSVVAFYLSKTTSVHECTIT